MRVLRVIIFSLLVLIVVAAISALLYGRYIARRALPNYNSDIVMGALDGKVEVFRDKYAVPHVYASTEHDLYMSVGYLSAQDRMWQMDLLRRVTQGRLSEIFGAELVDVDLTMRSLQIETKSKEVYSTAAPELKTALDAYTDGVNKYLEDQCKNLPLEFTILGYKPEPWDPTHSINLIGFMSWDLSMAWDIELVLYKIGRVVDSLKLSELYPELKMQQPPVYQSVGVDSEFAMAAQSFIEQRDILRRLGLQLFEGSNNWAVSGARSVDGKPMLANDMHLGLFAPGLWSQMHQVVEGKLDVTGVILPGQPFIIAGHNRRIAWGLTNVMLDDIDFYLETTDPDHPGMYYYNGEWRNFIKKTELIKIKGGEELIREILFTHRGPVVSDMKKVDGAVISMHWIGNEKSNEVQSVYRLNHAGNWDEFLIACDGFIAISQNIAYADVDGNFGFRTAAGVPVREGIRAFISPGDTSLYDWTGLVPPVSLPFTFNPSDGVVATANNKIVGDDYPYEISHWYDLPNRIRRIREMTDAKEKLSVEDFIRMQMDQESVFARELNALFINEIKWDETLEPTAREAFEALRQWDNVLQYNTAAPLIFETTYAELVAGLFKDELGEELFKEFLKQDLLASYVIRNIIEGKATAWADDVTTEGVTETIGDIIKSAFRRAVTSISAEYGNDIADWEWGMAHNISFKHPLGQVKALAFAFGLNRGPFPVGGSFHTVSPFSYDHRSPFKANHGAAQRHIYTLGNWDNSLTIIPTGVSGIPASKYYCDQTDMYLAYQYHPDPFSRKAVEAAAKYHMWFKPGE